MEHEHLPVTLERILLPLLLTIVCLVQASLLSSPERQMPMQEAIHLLLMEELAGRWTESPAEAKGRVSPEWIKPEGW